MSERSYKERVQQAKSQTYLKEVVSQPTVQSDVKAKVDKSSPTGISQDKPKGTTQ